jgi:hypothetical protein
MLMSGCGGCRRPSLAARVDEIPSMSTRSHRVCAKAPNLVSPSARPQPNMVYIFDRLPRRAARTRHHLRACPLPPSSDCGLYIASRPSPRSLARPRWRVATPRKPCPATSSILGRGSASSCSRRCVALSARMAGGALIPCLRAQAFGVSAVAVLGLLAYIAVGPDRPAARDTTRSNATPRFAVQRRDDQERRAAALVDRDPRPLVLSELARVRARPSHRCVPPTCMFSPDRVRCAYRRRAAEHQVGDRGSCDYRPILYGARCGVRRSRLPSAQLTIAPGDRRIEEYG